MKTATEVAEIRQRLLRAVHDFGTSHGFSFAGSETTAEQLFANGLGALALVDLILELPRPGNFENIVSALEKHAVTETKG